MKVIKFLPDAFNTFADVDFKDREKGNQGEWAIYIRDSAGAEDIHLYEWYFHPQNWPASCNQGDEKARCIERQAKNKKQATTQELGHALGFDHSDFGQVMGPAAEVITLQPHDKSDYVNKYGKKAACLPPVTLMPISPICVS